MTSRDVVPDGEQADADRSATARDPAGELAMKGAAAGIGDTGRAKRRPSRERPIAHHLVVLCLALFLPILVLASVLTWSYAASERNSIERETLSEAREVMSAVDRVLVGLMATTDVLSLSRPLQHEDLDEFDAQVREVYERLKIHVVLRDLSGQQLVNTRLPRGSPLPRNVDDSDRIALETKRPVVSNLLIGSVAKTPLFIVNVPVLREDEVIYFLNLSLPPERIDEIMVQRVVPEGWIAAVADGHGQVIASVGPSSDIIEGPLALAVLEKIANGNGKPGEVALEHIGEPVFAASSPSQVSGWFAVIAVPVALLSAPLYDSLLSLAAVAVLILALGGYGAVRFSRRIANPVSELASLAVHLGNGTAATPLATSIREVNAVSFNLSASAAKRQAAEAALRASDLHLREVQFELMHALRLSAMGQMAAALAHELNQPLGAATNYLNAARLALGGGRADGSTRALARIQKATEQTVRAGAILKRLRDFVSHGEADKRIVSASGLVREAVALAMSGVRDPQLKLRTPGLSQDPLLILVDSIQIQQVVFNLVRNAIEATEGREPREITVTTQRAGTEEVELSVTDTGPGLPADREALFRPFATTKHDGLGLGLSICRTIIEAHGGRLWAEVRPEGGAAFHFTVPAAHYEDTDAA